MNGEHSFLESLIRAGRQGEAAVQTLVAHRLADLGCAVGEMGYRPGDVSLAHEFADTASMPPDARVAVVGRLAGAGGGRSLILFAHPDSEPAPAEHGWSADPFEPRRLGDRLLGWGVADDLAGIALMVEGLAHALAGGWRPAGDVMAASTPSKRHARGVAAVLDRVPRPDAAVYLHPAESGSGLAEIKACTPGLLEFVIDIAGAPPDTAEPGHAAFTHRGRTTAGVVESVLAALRTLDAARGSRVRHPRIGSFVGRATNVMVSGIRAGMPGRRNRLPVAAVIEGSVSFPPGETLQAVMDEVAAAVRGAVLPAGWPAELAPRVAFPAGVAGAEVDGDHPLFLLAAGAIRSEAGIEPMVNPVHTASDIRVPIHQKGIPTIGLGPLAGDLTQNGRVDEWVNLRDQSLAASVLGRLIRDWCG